MILHAWRDILQSCSITDDDDLQTKTFFVFAPNKTNLTPALTKIHLVMDEIPLIT